MQELQVEEYWSQQSMQEVHVDDAKLRIQVQAAASA